MIPVLKNHRKGWTAVYNSNSAQEAGTSCQSPRIISFGRDGKLILTWINCKKDEDKKDYPDCEKMEISELKKNDEFEFSEASLPGEHSEKEVRFSEKNPARCIHCHGKPSLPIFESYNTWPGTFGSVTRVSNDVIKRDSKEDQCYQEFLNNVRSKNAPPRFKELYFDFNRTIYDSTVKDIAKPVNHSVFSDPNFQLTVRVYDQSASTVASQIMKSPQFAPFRYAFVAHALRTVYHQCIKDKISDFEEYFPVSHRIGEVAYKEKFENILRKTKKDTKKIKEIILENNPMQTEKYKPKDPLEYFDSNTIGAKDWKIPAIQFTSAMDFDYLAEQIEFPMRRIGPSTEQKYNQPTGVSELHNLISGKLLSALETCDPELKKIMEMTNPEEQCEILKSKSKAAIESFRSNIKDTSKRSLK